MGHHIHSNHLGILLIPTFTSQEYIPYSRKFSIEENFRSVRPRAEGSILNSAKIKSIENKIPLCVRMHTQLYTMAVRSRFTISPEWRCHYYRFSRSCRVDSFQALLSVVFLIGNWGEANAAVTSVYEQAAANKCGHYHHLSVSMHAIGKYASENGNSAAARHFSNFAQLVGVFEIIIAEILCP